MSLVGKLGDFLGYELGDPMLRKIGHNYVQTGLNLKDRKYFEALKSTGKTLFHTAQEGMWLGMSALELAAVTANAYGLYSGNTRVRHVLTGAAFIALIELIKDIMNNPQRYSIVRTYRSNGTVSG